MMLLCVHLGADGSRNIYTCALLAGSASDGGTADCGAAFLDLKAPPLRAAMTTKATDAEHKSQDSQQNAQQACSVELQLPTMVLVVMEEVNQKIQSKTNMISSMSTITLSSPLPVKWANARTPLPKKAMIAVKSCSIIHRLFTISNFERWHDGWRLSQECIVYEYEYNVTHRDVHFALVIEAKGSKYCISTRPIVDHCC